MAIIQRHTLFEMLLGVHVIRINGQSMTQIFSAIRPTELNDNSFITGTLYSPGPEKSYFCILAPVSVNNGRMINAQ